MSYNVYVIQNKAGRIYIGYTADLDKRLKSHNEGRSFWTRNKGPWQIIHSEVLDTRGEAMIREKYLKTGVGRDFIARARSSVG